MVEEKGLQFTEGLFNSENFAELYERLRFEVDRTGKYYDCGTGTGPGELSDRYGNIKRGLTDEEADAFSELCEKEMNRRPPQGYLTYLKKMNGIDYRGQCLYGPYPDGKHDFYGDYPKYDVPMTDSEFYNENEHYFVCMSEDMPLLIIGRERAGNDRLYCYDFRSGEYASYDNEYNEDEPHEKFGSFAELFCKVLMKMYGKESYFYQWLPKEYAGYGEED